ncbi:hypothetical protein K435DRAFT_381126 [Dendrothele bispora CBS 962.96]|uniref:N-acetyltransferase domain-containing protein n=1 Tax=Dendrothele bispora (strain CBS 962.96) TaxID=1314807 RepID=A0A4S8MVQ3_DENBC|nr:hypothetical protein K435DRAFT_381126 [Dendrothele bispora CBS 962.96]
MTSETIIRAAVAKALFYVAIDRSTGAVVGTACWYPVGVDFLADEEQQEKAKAADLFAALQRDEPDIHHWWMNTFLPTLSCISNKYLGSSTEKNVKMENWTLYSLAVKPSHQGRRIGRKLVEIGEEQAFKQGVFACFETDNEKNLMIYQKLGYGIVGSDYVEGPPGKPGYSLYVLYKTKDLEVVG